MDVAASASSSSLLYFDPLVFTNAKGAKEQLIDGYVIAHNPSLYAFIHATERKGKSRDEIRIVSIGAGVTEVKKVDPKNVNAFSWILNLEDLIVNVEISTHDFLTKFLIGKDQYFRFQVKSELDLKAFDGS